VSDHPDHTPRPDEALVRYLASVLGTQSEVESTALFPAGKQESLVVHLDGDYYPDRVDAVFLEVRVYTNGEFNVSYVEHYLGEVRSCRWDRHEQDHNARDHVHPFPDAGTAGVVDREFPGDVTTLLRTVVLPWVTARVGAVWEE
jgi:hypothetical protein